MNASELITMITAAIGCAGGVTGVILSVKADRRSSRAEEENKLARLAVDSVNDCDDATASPLGAPVAKTTRKVRLMVSSTGAFQSAPGSPPPA